MSMLKSISLSPDSNGNIYVVSDSDQTPYLCHRIRLLVFLQQSRETKSPLINDEV
jgi:hypothetical protein